MEINKSKTLKIDWLGKCPKCDREEHVVSTSEGNKDYLYEDDTVKCWCGQTGVIETDGEGHAWCNWDEKAATEWDNFNLYYRQKFPEYWDLLPKANHQACQHHEELFNTWLAAKSQAVPEGFVLVKKELPEQIAEKMAIDRIDKPRHENDPVWSEIAEQSYKDQVKSKKWEFWRDYKAMIEAQEPAND